MFVCIDQYMSSFRIFSPSHYLIENRNKWYDTGTRSNKTIGFPICKNTPWLTQLDYSPNPNFDIR